MISININQILDIVVLAMFSTLVIVLIGWVVRLRLKTDKLVTAMTQLLIDKQALVAELDRVSFISDNSIDIENGFIKFLSDSRESAFAYIEDVQVAILNLKDAMESGDESQIAESYNKLISFLPSDSTDMVE